MPKVYNFLKLSKFLHTNLKFVTFNNISVFVLVYDYRMQFCRGELKDLPRPKGSPLFIALKVITYLLYGKYYSSSYNCLVYGY